MKNKMIFFLLLFVLGFSGSLFAQINVDSFWYREGELENWFVEQLSRAVVLLVNNSSGNGTTGILLGTSPEKLMVLTNSHLLKSSDDTVYVSLCTKDNRINFFKCNLIKRNTDYDLSVFKVTIEGQDIPGLILNGFVSTTTLRTEIPDTNAYLSTKDLSDILNIKRGNEIIFLGFPLNLGIEEYTEYLGKTKTPNGEECDVFNKYRLKKPVFRSGKIASEIYQGNFLIDAMVSHGNSGSPVFVRTGHTDVNGVTSDYKFVGILKRFVSDNIDFRSDAGQVLSLPHNTGLGEVVSIEIIKEFLKDVK